MLKDVIVRGLRAGYESPLGFFGTGRREVIAGIDLIIPAGQIVALIAPNGVGKSTLMRAIVAEWTRWEGEVLVGDSKLRQEEVAWLPQNPALTLAPWHQVWQEVAQPLLLRGESSDVSKVRVKQLMEELDFNLPLEQRVDRLSGGQKMRVAIMRALCTPQMPRLLIADEPMEGLDVTSRATLMRVIRKVASQEIPVLLTSHRPVDLYELGATSLELIGNPVTSIRQVNISNTEYTQVLQNKATEKADYKYDETAETKDTIKQNSENQVSVSQSYSSALFASVYWGLFGLVSGLIIWKILSLLVNNFSLLPSPDSIFLHIGNILVNRDQFTHVLATTLRALVSLLIGAGLAIPIGIIIGYDKRVYAITAPWIAALRAMPVLLLVGVAAGLFPRQPEIQRHSLVILTLFVIGLQIMSATAAVAPRRRIELTRILGGRLIHRLKVLFHEVMAGAFAFLEVALPLSILATILIETLLIPKWGLGGLTINHLTDRDLSLLFALITLPGIVGAFGTWLLRQFSRFFRYEL